MRLIDALRRPVVRDVALALLLVGSSAMLMSRYEDVLGPKYTPNAETTAAAWRVYVAWWWIASLPAVASLLLRRRRPLAAVVLAAASSMAHLLVRDLWPLPIDLATVVAVYTLASVSPRRQRAVHVLAAVLVSLYLTILAVNAGIAPPRLSELAFDKSAIVPWPLLPLRALQEAAAPALALGIAWAVGDNSRTRRLHLATLEQRAEDLRRERDHRAALAVAAERARITRELHDVVAHGISVMVVQAQGAAAAQAEHPDQTAAALADIVETGRASLAEMRRLVGLARADESGGASGGASADESGGASAGESGGASGGERRDVRRAPQPGLGALPTLIDQIRDAGTPVTLLVEGEPAPLPAGVDLSAYRIVQEALTNVLKHAGAAARATVRLAFHLGELEIEVTDTGTAGKMPSAVDGNGLRGIAERVRLLGGSVHAGPRPGGGFGVLARLPTEARS